jgi:hypothetical protein
MLKTMLAELFDGATTPVRCLSLYMGRGMTL